MVLKREATNEKDNHAVCVEKNGQTVGHMPRNIATLIFFFLARNVNKGMVEITGDPLNRGAGMGMEVPCIFHLFGPKLYLKRLEDIIKKDFSSITLIECV